jgi:hypothetical protein
MLRTVAQQYLLYAWYMAGRCSIMLAAAPGGSNHESGLALDTSQYAAWQAALEAQGFKWFGSSDVVHFDYTGGGTIDLRPIGVRGFQRLWNVNHAADTIAEDGIYGPATESRLRQSPAAGFAMPAPCSAPPDAGTMDVRVSDATDARVSDATDTGTVPPEGGRSDAQVVDGPATTDAPPSRDVFEGGSGGASMIDAPARPDAPSGTDPDASGTDPDAGSGDASSLPPGALDAGCSCRVVAVKNDRSPSWRAAWVIACLASLAFRRISRRQRAQADARSHPLR